MTVCESGIMPDAVVLAPRVNWVMSIRSCGSGVGWARPLVEPSGNDVECAVESVVRFGAPGFADVDCFESTAREYRPSIVEGVRVMDVMG